MRRSNFRIISRSGAPAGRAGRAGAHGRMSKSTNGPRRRRRRRQPPTRARGEVVAGVHGEPPVSADGRRRIMADFLKSVGSRLVPEKPQPPAPAPALNEPADRAVAPVELKLSPRLRQTLARLLAGDSEKQVARHLALSKNTVHVYVKALYRQYNVNSRGELLARFVNGGMGKDEG
jgi:DNA-binding CsgD family transcriptional regulator